MKIAIYHINRFLNRSGKTYESRQIFSLIPCLLLGLFCFGTVHASAAQSPSDNKPKKVVARSIQSQDNVWAAYEGFNACLLDPARKIYKTMYSSRAAIDRNNGAAAIWCQPIYCDMAMNAYKLALSRGDKSRAKRYKKLCEDLFAGNIAHYANFDFDNNDENIGWFIYDDIQWWTITLGRAYELFKVEKYRTLAEASFARVWYGSPKVGDTGSYADPKKNLGGGMFWQWQPIHNPNRNEAGHGKMACINFPTVVAALTLYNGVPAGRMADTNPERWSNKFGDFVRPHYETKEAYLAKGKEIYDWAVNNLVDLRSGKVADCKHGSNPDWRTHVYNQATFIGASVLLYKATGEKTYLENAVKGADYTVNEMSEQGMLPFEKGIEQGIYTSIWAQYMAMLVYDCGQKQYLPFIRRNIDYGWINRDQSRNLCGGEYWRVLEEGTDIDSYSASGIPALMLLFPHEK